MKVLRHLAAALSLAGMALCLGGSAVNGSGLGGGAGAALSLHASATGTGSACSAASPCSLATARSQLSGHGGGTISLATGTYRQASAIALTSADSGETWQAESGATPTIVGSIQVTGWGVYSGSIQVATVPSGSYSRQLFVNGVRAQRARVAASTLGSFTYNATGWGGTQSVWTWPDILQAETHGVSSAAWQDVHCPITAAASGQLTVAPNCWGAAHGATNGYAFTYLDNALEALTRPGQWFLNTSTWNLYYWPKPSDGTLSSADVELPVVNGPLLSVTGTSGITISGLTIKYGTWIPLPGDGHVVEQGANPLQTVVSTAPYAFTYTTGGASMASKLFPANVLVSGSSNIIISGNTIQGMGSTALSVETSSYVTVSGNSIVDASGAGLNVGDINYFADQAASGARYTHDITVTNNFISVTGVDYASSPNVQTGFITNSTFSYNELLYSNYSGFMLGGWNIGSTAASWASNTYTHNRVQYCMHGAQVDGGCLYSTGPMASGLGDTYSYNVLTNQPRVEGLQYVDNYSAYKTWLGNVVQAPNIGGTCTAFFQNNATYPAVHNSMTAWYANFTQAACGESPAPDPSNTISVPTTITTARDSAVASLWSASGTTLRSPEIAYNKTATASSTLSGETIGMGNNSEGSSFYDYWASAAGDTAPWWQVDLGADYNVDTVEVYAWWGSSSATGNRSFQVEISDDPTFGTYTAIGHPIDSTGYCALGGGGYDTCVASFAASPAIRGRYARVAKYCAAGDTSCTVAEELRFAEVMVYGK